MEGERILNLIVSFVTGLGQALNQSSGIVTALATIVLAALTWALARATKAMAAATSSANVVASLETNQWSWMHVDLIVHNTGNAPAFDVSVQFLPPLPRMEGVKDRAPPFGKISILRPGHWLSSNINDFKSVSEHSYQVSIRWRSSPSAREWSATAYEIDLRAMGALSRLGAVSPGVQIAEQLKYIREDWQGAARGQRRIEVNHHTHEDRVREHEEDRVQMEELEEYIRKQETKVNGNNDTGEEG